MNIPLMHDDQHGTAIISSAALLNALDLVNKKIEKVKFVINGAGAAAIACTKLYVALGAKTENILMFDINGLISLDRPDLDEYRRPFATSKKVDGLNEAVKNADVFIGLSAGNVLTQEHIKSMAKNPIVFALANPDPEIQYDLAMAARKDLIMATGRSDHPNQVNNVLGFPYIFRGALDVRATEINEAMKLAAVYALAKLARETVPDSVSKAYGEKVITFGKEYLIPKPLDPRLITTISPAVAKAAIESGVAQRPITNWEEYDVELQKRIGIDNRLISKVISRAKKDPQRIIFAEADSPKILKAAHIIKMEGIGIPILLGNKNRINYLIAEHDLDLQDCVMIDPLEENKKREYFADILYKKRQRKGMTLHEARKLMKERNYYASAMLEVAEGDALVSGLTKDYPKTILPALHIIGVDDGVKRVAGMYIINNKRGSFFFADTTVNTNPTVDQLVEITGLTAQGVKFFDITPRIAILSYSNFGSSKGDIPDKTMLATQLAKEKYPELVIEGEMQANVALDTEIQQENFPFSALAQEPANTLIFPDLASGNIAYKLLMELGNAEAIGPILMGMKKPVHILQLGSSVREIVNIVAIAALDAIEKKTQKKKI
jgi:malate dehydrogenase (oxaloacetate-decarboxylating)(NADP+)